MTKRNIEAIYPLSPLQRGILFHTIYDSESRTYTVQLSCPLYGHLDTQAFKDAWQRVVDRHPILRTLFTWEGRDEPLQIVRSQVRLSWGEIDWRHLSGDEQKERLEDYLEADRARGFELTEAPLMRMALVRLADDAHQFVWSKHHLLLDGWSSLRIMEETLALYESFSRGQDLFLERPRPYRDYIAWLKQQDMSGAEKFWRRLLKGFSSPTPLPLETGSGIVPTREASDREQRCFLPATLTAALQSMARERGFTLNTLILGAWALLQSRYSGEADLVVGATVSGRPTDMVGVESMVGLFINTLPVRLQVSPGTFLLPWLKGLQAQQVEARQYEYSPLVDVQGWSDVPRGTPLFRTYMVFENYPARRSLGERRENGNHIEIGDFHVAERPNYPLLVVAIPGEQLQLRVLYDSRRYDASAIKRLLRHLQTLLDSMAANADGRLSDLSFLTPSEEHQILLEWGDTEAHFPPDVYIPELIQGRAALTPDAVAVRFEDEQVSYSELNIRANRLAHYLKGLGVGPEVRVGICVERSVEMVVGLLAIMKAGGAYVPLDPGYPGNRLGYMMEDAGTAIVLTQARLQGRLPQSFAIEVCLDTEWDLIEEESDTAPQLSLHPGNLAYVLYTSGSTGRPKGVAIPHGSLTHHMQWMEQEFGLSEKDRVLQKTPFSFDASVWEFWAPLMSGAELVMARPGGHVDGEYMVKVVEETNVTLLQLVPAQLRLMLEAGGLGRLSSLRQVFCGGEALGRELQEEASSLLASGLCNLYGPTEATVDTIFWRCESTDGLSAPIGKPIANTRAYVLDSELCPVPAGVAAELYITGSALGRGYWNKPELTADKFIPDSFGAIGERMYRTGDLARHLNDGTLSYIGRTDNQVKVRGFRIELGEIEELLCQHQSVRAAAVLAREDEPGVKRLVSYVVANGGGPLDTEELLSYLRGRLPEYMQPATCVVLEAMPLTPNGKLDRRALPRPEIKIRAHGYESPRNVVEEALCAIWSHVLGVERVGIEDNFFKLGGDSILCIQVVSRARQAGYNLAPINLFEHQTIAELASVIDTNHTFEPEKVTAESSDIPLVPIQRRFFEQKFVEPHYYNQAVLLKVRQPLDATLLEKSLGHLLRHHDAFRLRFAREESRWRQFTAGPGEDAVPFSQLDLSGVPESEKATALESAAADLQHSLNLSEGPLVRVALFHLGAQEADRLLIIIHHLVVDGVSWRILIEDLQSAYEQLSAGDEVRLPPSTTPFSEWSERLHKYSQGPGLRQKAEYWLSSEWDDGASKFPVDNPSGQNTMASARTISVSLSAAETQALLREVPAAYHTQINDVLLSALARAYTLWTGSDFLLVDLEGHGREAISEDVDLSRTVGWFTSVFPVYLKLEGENAGTFLKGIKEQLRAIPERGFSYGVLRYLSGDEEAKRRLDSLQRPQISFNYLGQFDQIFSDSSLFIPAEEGYGPVQSRDNLRSHLINLNGMMVNGCLRIEWTYSKDIHRLETIGNLANLFAGCLRVLIAHCQSPKAGGYTPSDFPLAGLDQSMLDRCIGSDRSVEDIYPLSPMQQGVLFHSAYAPDPSVYFVQLNCRIQGPINVEAFKRAWQNVVSRHSILRTSFLWKGLQEPLQFVHESAEVKWRLEDWQRLTPYEQRLRLKQFLLDDQEQGFEFSSAPLMRLALMQTGEDDYIFVWSSHHLLYDAWCRELIIGEVFTCYERYARHSEPELKRARPYRDYIAWLKRQDTGRAKAFWEEELRGFSTPTHLARDRGRPAQQGDQKDEQTILLSVGETDGVAALAKRFHVSLNTVVQGAWALVLSSHSGEADVVFGATVSGRSAPLEGIESMVGLFINTLPVRVQVRDEETVESFLKRMQAGQARAIEHELSPLMQVQVWSEVSRGTPLFEYLFLFQNYPVHGAIRERAGALLEITEVGSSETVNYPLMMVAEPGTRLRLKAAYDTGRFDENSIASLLEHMRHVLAAMASGADRRVGQIALPSKPERHRALVECNDTGHDFGAALCIHELFYQQAQRTPDAVAVSSEEGQLSYSGLNDRADRLARHLAALGAGPETRVAICVERGLDTVIGLLGVLKSGAAYVPMDPNYPTGRLAYMLDNSQSSLLLTQERLLAKLPDFTGKRICLDGGWEGDEPGWVGPGPKATAQNLAYVIYTSGSTGKPKGVAVSHGALANYISWAKDVYLRGEELDFCLYSSLAFDLTITSVYTPLVTGNKVQVLRQQGREPLPEEIMSNADFGILKLTPSHLLMIKQRDNRHSAVKRLIVGGEAFDASLASEVYESFGGGVEIYNEYGPTEATVGCMIYRWDADQTDQPMVSIGRPAANTQIYLLDRSLNVVPQSVSGELYIGGEGLARGYLGQPELTAERFIPDPFCQRPGARVYKTGDLARYGPDGSINFIGRADHQVKIRGFRIEPGEVEFVLGQYEAVRENRVVAQKDASGDVRLVAYVVPKEKRGPSVESMRSFLGEKLPSYMVPAAYVTLDAFPLTPNGKVDIRALPTAQGNRPELESAYAAPRSKIERTVAAIWQEALHIEKVGIGDNFFDLGGHSILLMQVHSKLEELLGREISMVELFEYPTISSLVAHLTEQKGEPPAPGQDDKIEERSKQQHRLRERLRQRQQAQSGGGKA